MFITGQILSPKLSTVNALKPPPPNNNTREQEYSLKFKEISKTKKK